MEDAILLLEDGTRFTGRSFGAPGPVIGEVVFNTSLTGYQEILTDPSYAGQLVALTTPQIGNTGVNHLDQEAPHPHARALLVREISPTVSSWRAEGTLPHYLRRHGVFGLTDFDTRALTRHLRTRGAMRGILARIDAGTDPQDLLDRVRAAPSMTGADLVQEVSCRQRYAWSEPTPVEWLGGTGSELELVEQLSRARADGAAPVYRVVAVDCGIKQSILRQLVDHGFQVTVVPADTPAEAILELKPDGLFLSNGPGDPAAVTYTIRTVRQLLGKVPLFGICLGHQILGLALGGSTFKLKFGHRGGNHPVKDLRTGQVAITSHNHGFAVDPDSLPADVKVTHVDLNDGTCEGLEHAGLMAYSIQYHPEAAPGPHDALEHFQRFRELIARNPR
jgi:carbamoyl-phosphate synthase small subunit